MNATDSDAGNYTCRAEVDEFGNYAERFISVAVNSASLSILSDELFAHLPTNYELIGLLLLSCFVVSSGCSLLHYLFVVLSIL